MALRDKLAERVAPYLEPGEELRQVFMAQTGPNPMWVVLTWLTMLWNKYYIVAVTDRSVITFRATAFKPSFVKKGPEMHRLERRQQLGPLSGLWASTEIQGVKVWVHKRFHKDVNAADADLSALGGPTMLPGTTPTATAADAAAPAAGWYPDPQGVAAQRYWDGTTWTDHTA